jgi:acetylornithine/N-succinyldiaminopimelate aminotransferase
VTHADIIALEERYQLRTYRKKPIVAVRGEGCWLWDSDGRRYTDLYGGHCVALLGHSHPAITRVLKAQLDELLFYSNAVYSPVRAHAAKALADIAPEGLGNVFFCNSGTEANETALKLARKSTGRPVILAMKAGFHGRTLGSLAVTWGESYRAPYAECLGPAEFVPFGDADAVETLLRSRQDIAAVILEPIQSMAGVIEAPARYFQRLREVCSGTGTVLIFDEIQTGVGRTGTFSISEQFGMTPDLITLAKSLGNGVPVGAVLVNDAIAGEVSHGDQGTTFGGGMLAMAAVDATLQVLKSDRIMERVKRFESEVRDLISPLVLKITGAGCLLGLDLARPAKPVIAALLDRGFIVGGADDPNVIRLMPPAVTPLETVSLFATALAQCLHDEP